MNRETFRNMDYGLLWSVIFLMVMGVIMIHSAATGSVNVSEVWHKQAVFVVISIFVMFGVMIIPYKFFYVLSYVFYGAGLVFLIMTDFFGTMGGGSERWLSLGGLNIQPSEFMKVAVVLALARYLSDKDHCPNTYARCIGPFLFILIPMGLVLLQPDLGTALVFCAIIMPMLWWAGLDNQRLFFLLAPAMSAVLTAPFIPFAHPVVWVLFMFGLLAIMFVARMNMIGMGASLGTNILAGIAMPFMFNHLKPYQQQRITSFLNPEADPLRAGYQIINSKITIGSGGLFGKGLGNGRYSELGFLPRAHTDFIFSVVGEELGFLGAVLIILVFFYVIYRALAIASEVKNRYMSIAATGIATVFAFHMFINIGMVVGIMPVTGLPLPFLSAGGSSCMTNAVMIGLLLNFRINRHEY